jgi:hypothetical protein
VTKNFEKRTAHSEVLGFRYLVLAARSVALMGLNQNAIVMTY